MKHIEVSTAHNIIMSYSLASLGMRMIAYVIDLFIVYIVFYLVIAILSFFSTFAYVIALVMAALYHFLFECYNNGQSPGKALLKLRVVNIRGTRPTSQDLFTRAMFRLADITFTAGILAIWSILTSDRNQRLGDRLANTMVIQERKHTEVGLDYLKSIGDTEHSFTYPQVTMFNDEEMIIVKETLVRYKKYPNDAHRDVLKDLAVTIADRLQVDIKGQSATQFLQQLIEEYVLLTR